MCHRASLPEEIFYSSTMGPENWNKGVACSQSRVLFQK